MMGREIVAINRGALSAITADGNVCPITNLIDDAGAETDDISEAVSAIVRIAADAWAVVVLADFETARVH